MTPQGRINAGRVGGVTNPDGVTAVPVTVNTPRPTPTQLADALIKSLGLSEAELTALRHDTGVDLRQSYIDGFRRNGVDYNAIHYAGRDAQTNAPKYTGSIGVPSEFRHRIARYADRDSNAAPLPPQDSRSGNNGATTTAQGQELTARGAMMRRRLERQQERNDVKRELLGVSDATTLGAASAIALRGLPQAASTAAPAVLEASRQAGSSTSVVAAPALIEAAPVVAAATVTMGGAALIINGQLDASIDRYLDTLRSAPPVQMSDAEDAPPPLTPTDTAERPTQPDVQVAPEGGALTRPAPATPTASSQPTTGTPQPYLPDVPPPGEPPHAPQGRPPFDPARLVPPAIGTATTIAGKEAADALSSRAGGRLDVEPGRTLTLNEQRIAGRLVAEGHHVVAKAEVNRQGVRTADFEVDGVATELKTVSNITGKDMSASLSRRILDGAGQAPHIIVDARGQAGMTREIAESGIRRAYGFQHKYANERIRQVRIVGNGFDITSQYEPLDRR